eukprot:6312004-Amphidinium_carterae.3
MHPARASLHAVYVFQSLCTWKLQQCQGNQSSKSVLEADQRCDDSQRGGLQVAVKQYWQVRSAIFLQRTHEPIEPSCRLAFAIPTDVKQSE